MEPGIGRALKHGFLAANHSWPGIGVFAGGWLLLLVLFMIGVSLTNPPAELLEEPRRISERAMGSPPEIGGPAVTVSSPQASAPTGAPTPDLFNQLSTTDDAARSTQTALTPAPLKRLTERERAAEEDRLLREWLGRAWPGLLVVLLLAGAGNLWLAGAQVSYLAKRVVTGRSHLGDFWRGGAEAWGRLVVASLISLAGLAFVRLFTEVLGSILTAAASIVPGGLMAVIDAVLGIGLMAAVLWVVVRLSVWFIGIIVDHRGPLSGCSLSWRSTRGRWWRVAGLLALLGGINLGLWLVFMLAVLVLSIIGGVLGVLLLVGVAAACLTGTFYLNFAAMGSLVRFYEDLKASLTAGAPLQASTS